MEERMKVAIVTGGSRGIGRRIAETLAAEGYKVLACGRGSNDASKLFLDEASSMAGIIPFYCDVTDGGAVNDMVKRAYGWGGSIDVLVNAAGISPKKNDGMKIPCYELDYSVWQQVMDINLNGAFLVSKMVLPYMIEKRYGRIVNISSVVGLTSSEHGPASAAYVASKTGLVGLTRAMAYDVAEYGITVNAVAPGRISTEMSAENNQVYNDLHKKLIPMHRFGTVDDVAKAVMFYISPDSGYITGDVMNITGGWFL